MREPPAVSGFTLIELMVALVLLSVVSLDLATTLVSAHRGLVASNQWMRATQLAAEGLEQLRTGQVLEVGQADAEFRRSASESTWPGHASLRRLEVTVSWNDGANKVQLVTLARH